MPCLKASSPKSLSNVIRTRFSSIALFNTTSSLMPGASLRIQEVLYPKSVIASTTSPVNIQFFKVPFLSEKVLIFLCEKYSS
jgi:hypothetical protein